MYAAHSVCRLPPARGVCRIRWQTTNIEFSATLVLAEQIDSNPWFDREYAFDFQNSRHCA